MDIVKDELQKYKVAPYAGAWIEMKNITQRKRHLMSLLMQERGLKLCRLLSHYQRLVVAPYAGAWIEIRIACAITTLGSVAPYAGAWIEIEI